MMAEPLHERARGRWREILTAIGLPPGSLTGKHGPCPLCGGKDRFRFDDKQGSGSFFCSGCGAGYGVNLVMKFQGCDFATAAREVERVMGENSEIAKNSSIVPMNARADRLDGWRKSKLLWKQSLPVTEGDPVWLYLAARGLAYRADFRNHLRYFPRLNYVSDAGVQQHPAMICAISTVTGEGANILRTYLSPDGSKAPVPDARKLMSGDFPLGSAIRLGRAAEIMGVAEGVETALAAAQMHGIPVWAAVNANGLKTWQAPACARAIMVFGDNDANGVGQDAAHKLAYRLNADGLRVDVRIPDKPGVDWNDVIRGAA
jgi:putative DNA primase/helicase